MKIMVNGVETFVIPEQAQCQLSGENPMIMEECPRCGDCCTPDECNEYIENPATYYSNFFDDFEIEVKEVTDE